MTDRDELARDLGNALDASSDEYFGYSDTKSVSWTTLDGKWDLRETADHLIAAGYRKPRTITTVEELDALPEASVITDKSGGVWWKVGDGWWPHTSWPGWDGRPDAVLKHGPINLLYVPEGPDASADNPALTNADIDDEDRP